MAIKVIYTGYQLYFVEMAIHMANEEGWRPVYWFTLPDIEDTVRSKFPGVITHNYYDAIKGIPTPACADLPQVSLDHSLLTELAFHESIALNMMDRNDISDSFKHPERLGLYHNHLRYWLTILRYFKPEFVIFEEEPHQACDYVLYILCKKLTIRTILFIRTPVDKLMFPVESFEEGSRLIISKYKEKIATWNSQPVSLPPEIEQYLNTLRSPEYKKVQALHLYHQLREVDELIKSHSYIAELARAVGYIIKFFNFRKWPKRINVLLKMIEVADFNDQKQKGKSIKESKMTSWEVDYYLRKTIRTKRKLRFYYNKLVDKNINLENPYVFCALHYQPEKTTSPNGGHFVNQLLMIDLLSKSLPDGWFLYVKEHISEFIGNRFEANYRSKDFYDEIVSLPNVRFISLLYNPLELIDKSQAVATITGTVAWEAVVRGKPVLTFGHTWYKSCEGIFYTPTQESLKEALTKIASGYKVDYEKVRLFVQTLDQLGFRGAVGGQVIQKHWGIAPEENGRAHANAIKSLLKSDYLT